MQIELPTAEKPVTLVQGDCLEVLRSLPDACVDTAVVDPPYNQGIAEWDFVPDYLRWSAEWVREVSRVLKPAGAFWCFHGDPALLADVSRLIESAGRRRVSFLTLDKSRWTLTKRYRNSGSKSLVNCAEYAVYHRRDVFAEEIRAARDRVGLTRGEFDTLISPSRKPTGLCYRWEHGECVPRAPETARIRELFGASLTLPTFRNPKKLPCVWRFPQPERFDHPTVKPLSLITRIVRMTTPAGGLVFDPFAGSGTAGVAATLTWRRAILVEREPAYCDIIRRRLAHASGTAPGSLFAGVQL